MNFDAEILKAAETADPFYELCSFKLMWRARHDVDLDATTVRTDKMFDNRGVLVALVLQP